MYETKEKAMIEKKQKYIRDNFDIKIFLYDFCEYIGITRQALYYIPQKSRDDLQKKIKDIDEKKIVLWKLEKIKKKVLKFKKT